MYNPRFVRKVDDSAAEPWPSSESRPNIDRQLAARLLPTARFSASGGCRARTRKLVQGELADMQSYISV